MGPIRRKKCCVPYCSSVQELSNKQFFKIGANLVGREKWLPSIGKTIAAKSQVLYCCEDHFDLPNDAENYIRYKYFPGIKLKLCANVLPQKNLPVNVCRLCLKLIFNGEDFVDISEKKGSNNAQIVKTTLPEIDLSVTVEPVVCVKCFDPLEKYHGIKQKALNSEVIVVNCIKSIVKRSPTRLIKSCEIDLFEDYNDIIELLEKDKSKDCSANNDKGNKNFEEQKVVQDHPGSIEDNQNIDRDMEEIVIQIEEPNENKYNIEIAHGENLNSDCNQLKTLPEEAEKNSYKLGAETNFNQEDLNVIEDMCYKNNPQCGVPESSNVTSENSNFTIQNIVSLQNISDSSVESSSNIQYKVMDNPIEGSSDNVYMDIEKEPSEKIVKVNPPL